jgi:hypothetical protein
MSMKRVQKAAMVTTMTFMLRWEDSTAWEVMSRMPHSPQSFMLLGEAPKAVKNRELTAEGAETAEISSIFNLCALCVLCG